MWWSTAVTLATSGVAKAVDERGGAVAAEDAAERVGEQCAMQVMAGSHAARFGACDCGSVAKDRATVLGTGPGIASEPIASRRHHPADERQPGFPPNILPDMPDLIGMRFSPLNVPSVSPPSGAKGPGYFCGRNYAGCRHGSREDDKRRRGR
jgi:hypothetical protein